MSDEEIKSISNSIDYDSNTITDFGNGIILTKEEISILQLSGFEPSKYSSLSSLIFDVSEYIRENGESSDELDDILDKMSERSYYRDTIK